MPSRVKFLISLAAFTIVLRVLPYVLTNYDIKLDPGAVFYPWNFSPLMAIGLFSGAFVADRRLRYGLPLLTLLLSDVGIWAVTGQFAWAFPSDRWSAYLCTAVSVILGFGLNRQSGGSRAFAAVGRGIFAEVLFFVVTNFVYFWTQTDLPHTASGLVACYVAAIPYAGRSFVSTIFYSLLLFSPLANRTAIQPQEAAPTLQPVRSA